MYNIEGEKELSCEKKDKTMFMLLFLFVLLQLERSLLNLRSLQFGKSKKMLL